MITGAIWVGAFAMDAEIEAIGHGDVESLCKFLILIYTKDTAKVVHF